MDKINVLHIHKHDDESTSFEWIFDCAIFRIVFHPDNLPTWEFDSFPDSWESFQQAYSNQFTWEQINALYKELNRPVKTVQNGD